MQSNTSKTVAIIGAGVIGQSWAAAFLSGGYLVSISDPQEGIENTILQTLPDFLKTVPGKKFNDSTIKSLLEKVSFHKDIKDAAQNAIAVQENGPESPDFKANIFAQLEEIVPEDTLLLSSSSGITPEVSGHKMKNSDRVIIGHPFNPPHILPLVEVCGTKKADPKLLQKAISFYRSFGKAPVLINKSVPGFVANRLQCALCMEALHLIEDGVVDMAGLDEIVLNSLGPRWASVGPMLAGHMGGGHGGLDGIIKHILNTLAIGMGLTPLGDEALERVGQNVRETYPDKEMPMLIKMRDERTEDILAFREKEKNAL